MSGRESVLTGRGLKIIGLLVLGFLYTWISVSPANAQGFAVAYPTTEFTISPGGNFIGSIPVTNMSEEPITLRMYFADWIANPEDTSSYFYDEEGGNNERSLMGFMTFSPERMTLEPNETRDVVYEINVPDDSALEGSYWIVIFIEKIATEQLDSPVLGEGEIVIGLTTVFRYAIHIFASIEGTETREVIFSSLNLEQTEGGFNAIATMQNSGNAYVKPIVWLEIRDTAGVVVFTQDHGERMVLPETARDFVFELRDLTIESGEYLVMVIADYGVQGLIAAQGRVDLTITPPVGEGAAGEEGEGESAGEDGSGATGEGSPSG